MFLRVNRKNKTFLLLAAACVFLRHFLHVHYFWAVLYLDNYLDNVGDVFHFEITLLEKSFGNPTKNISFHEKKNCNLI